MEVKEMVVMRDRSTFIVSDAFSLRAGEAALVLGALFLASTGFAYVLSLSDAVNPPDWVRVVGLVWLPLGLLTPVAYALARVGPGRGRGRWGVGLAAVAVAAFVVLVVVAG
jgi:hypothetical protein